MVFLIWIPRVQPWCFRQPGFSLSAPGEGPQAGCYTEHSRGLWICCQTPANPQRDINAPHLSFQGAICIAGAFCWDFQSVTQLLWTRTMAESHPEELFGVSRAFPQRTASSRGRQPSPSKVPLPFIMNAMLGLYVLRLPANLVSGM